MNADGSPITCIQGDIKFTTPAVEFGREGDVDTYMDDDDFFNEF